MKSLLDGGMKWKETEIPHGGGKKWESENGNFGILLTAEGTYRLISFIHEPSTQFPQAEFWMREYPTLGLAAHQAEMM